MFGYERFYLLGFSFVNVHSIHVRTSNHSHKIPQFKSFVCLFFTTIVSFSQRLVSIASFHLLEVSLYVDKRQNIKHVNGTKLKTNEFESSSEPEKAGKGKKMQF